MSQQQAVVDKPDGQAAPVSEGASAPEPSIDELLQEFDQGKETKSDTKTETKVDPARLERVLDEFEVVVQERAAERVKNDVDTAVKTAVGDTSLDPEYVKGVLYARVSENPAYMKAWQNRHQKPEQWSKLLKTVGKDLSSKTSRVDPNATEDMAAVQAAVRSQSTKSADSDAAPNFSRMSDAEFERHKRKLRGG